MAFAALRARLYAGASPLPAPLPPPVAQHDVAAVFPARGKGKGRSRGFAQQEATKMKISAAMYKANAATKTASDEIDCWKI